MKPIINISFFFCFLILLSCNSDQREKKKIMIPAYPETKKDTTVVDDYHGMMIYDPFRWLEDDNSAETKDWVVRQNQVTDNYLAELPYRKEIEERLTELWDYEKYSSPFKEGDYFYYFKNDGLQNQSVLYRTQNVTEDGEVVIDPNSFSDDGTASLAGLEFDKDGKYLAYFVSEGGSDWRTARVLDLSTMELLEDKLAWIKFSGISWFRDGFFYSRYPTPEGGDELSAKNEFHSLYYHKLGTSQSEDELIYNDQENPLRNVYAQTTEDERFLIVSTTESTSGNAVAFADLEKGMKNLFFLVDNFDNDYNFIDNDGRKLLFQTNAEAVKNCIIAINVDRPNKKYWETIIPESEDALRNVSMVGGKMFLNYMHDASSLVKVFSPQGEYIENLDLPGIGSVGGVSGKKSDKTGFFTFTSFTVPSTIYQLNTEDLSYEVFRKPSVDFDPNLYMTEQVWYSSKDGTKVPMFITKRKDVKLDGQNPTLLYGYGGFNIPILPGFSLTKLPLLESGGVYAVANIRGGGEFGKEWHKAGTLDQKQNVFDDFIAAAEYLIKEKYTSNDKLAIEGGSNGGLLVGACMTQRPDLFAVAFPRVGVLDMLRYHEFTIGWAWATDYGRSDDPKAFEYLIKYSPLHNVKPAAYPATMVMTADHDDRVIPAHSFKYAAELQRKHNGDNPVLIRIETSAGHGAGKPTSKTIEENADMTAFLLYNTNAEFTQNIKG